MNIDDIISLLLFLVFIVVPILSRAGRRRGRGQTRRQSGRGQQTGRAPPGQAPSTPATTAGPQTAGDEFTKRLEEARRRVQAAMEGQSAQGRPEAATGQESAGDLFRPSSQVGSPNTPSTTARPPSGSLIGSMPTSMSFLPAESQTAFASLDKRKKAAPSKPLQVQRSLKKRAKRQGHLLDFGDKDILRGIIWKQILDEPRGKQSWRQQSQRP